MLTAKGCGSDNPCRRGANERCARCEANDVLTADDVYLLGFYRLVSDQYINQTPMGAGKDHPMVTTPRLEGYEAALRLYEYPREHWAWLTTWAIALHRFHKGLDELTLLEWQTITPESVRG